MAATSDVGSTQSQEPGILPASSMDVTGILALESSFVAFPGTSVES